MQSGRYITQRLIILNIYIIYLYIIIHSGQYHAQQSISCIPSKLSCTAVNIYIAQRRDSGHYDAQRSIYCIAINIMYNGQYHAQWLIYCIVVNIMHSGQYHAQQTISCTTVNILFNGQYDAKWPI